MSSSLDNKAGATFFGRLWKFIAARLAANMLPFLTRKVSASTHLEAKLYLLLNLCLCLTAWPHETGDNCPSSKWNVMCRPCCEYRLIQCRCPSKGSKVGYTVPCCRNALDECDPCIFHPGCSLFENCKTCHNGTWKANDDFFVNGQFCTECRHGWSGGDCRTCGAVIQRAQGHIAMESYPTNARCEWTLQVTRGSSIELRFSRLSLESDHNCRYDYVEVRDGSDLSSPVIGRFCGDQLPAPIKSSGNVLHVLFVSDGYNNFDGFVLTYQESSVSAVKNQVCALPEKLLNGYLMPLYGMKEELVSVNYRCHTSFTLIGSKQRICLPNNAWSGTHPTCVKEQPRVRCSPPHKLLNGYHRTVPDTAGGAEKVEFFCKNTYILSGSHQSACLSNGSWSGRPPKCVRACREPKVSELVRQNVVMPNLISRENPDQRLLLSSRFSMQGLLSAGFTPLALDKRSNEDDTVELPRGFHPVHTSIEYKCASALYRHTGSSRRTCLKSGRWSGRHVSCKPVCGKFDTSRLNNLTDAPWPWHAAIYIRSPPDHTATTHRPRGVTTYSQQGASEESTFWYLACSGALLSQRSVLVAARCVVDKDRQQTLHPAHVKVVIGMKYQTAKDRQKGPHHLRVLDISVHPRFSSAPDSVVAVLKLRDKARISERVLPVCLPKVQGGEVTPPEAYAARWILPSRSHLSRNAPLSRTRLVKLGDVAQCERDFARGGADPALIRDKTLCVIRKPSSPQSPCPGVIPGITTVPAASSSTSGVWSGHEETRGDYSGGWQLLGLESFSHKEENCYQQTYTVHTRIASFRDWIEKNTK